MLQMNDQIETPKTVKAAKTASALAKFVEANKGKKVNETDKKAAGAAFKKVMGEREKIVAQLDAFDKNAQKVSEQMIACYGNTQIVVDGVRYVPTSRGERIFYKKMSDSTETVEL